MSSAYRAYRRRAQAQTRSLLGVALLWVCGVIGCGRGEQAHGAAGDPSPTAPAAHTSPALVNTAGTGAAAEPTPLAEAEVAGDGVGQGEVEVEVEPPTSSAARAVAGLRALRDLSAELLAAAAQSLLRASAARMESLTPSGVKVVDPASCVGEGSAFHGCLKAGEVALTFDDGPHPEYTLQILDILDQYRVKATFFVVGKQARKHPEVIREALRRGHTVATHTESHAYLKALAHEDALAEIQSGYLSARKAAGEAGEVSPLFRFPGGRTCATGALHVAAARAGLITLYWNIDGNDTQARSEARRQLRARGLNPKDERLVREAAAGNVFGKVVADIKRQRRGIILLHDIQAHTVLALPPILEELAFPLALAPTAAEIGVAAFTTLRLDPPHGRVRPFRRAKGSGPDAGRGEAADADAPSP